mgnify:CR=1 FL=1
MDYLVVAPHTPFFQWQVAMLVQSFRLQSMEENLAILLIAGSASPQQSQFCKWFSEHPRLKAVRLPADSNPDIMRLHGLAYAVKNKFVSQNFTILPPYCMLRHPLAPPQANITFSCQSDFTFPQLDSFGISSNAISKRLGEKRQWLPVGDVFMFNDMMPEFFNLATGRGEMIAFDSYREMYKGGNDFVLKGLFRAALAMATMETYGRVKTDTSRRIECHMNDHDQTANVINYYYGFPPDFSRTFYPMDGQGMSLSDTPVNGILRSPDTHASIFMKQVVSTMVT